MKSRRRILFKVVAVVVLAVVAFLWLGYHRSKGALEGYKRQLIAAGEKLTIEEVTPKPTSPERNGRALFLNLNCGWPIISRQTSSSNFSG